MDTTYNKHHGSKMKLKLNVMETAYNWILMSWKQHETKTECNGHNTKPEQNVIQTT